MSARRRAKPTEALRRPVCLTSGKTMWPTKKAAKGSASTAAKRTGTKLRVYKCQFCKDWHLTSQEKR